MNRHLEMLADVDYRTGDPQQQLSTWLKSADEARSQLLIVDFELPSPWHGEGVVSALTAVFLSGRTGLSQLLVTDQRLESKEGPAAPDLFRQWQRASLAVVYELHRPLVLEQLSIPKPWGQEIWYTGIEERGVCSFIQGECRTPIPWLQAVVPHAALGEPGAPPVLLKILDPSAEPVTGDLYFELHDEKREVYVVTHVDRAAWPDGVGAIRYGFDPERVASAGSDEAFRVDYLAAVQDYEKVRRAIDDSSPGSDIPAELAAEESRLRAEMDAFTAMMPLRVGDVVRVPLLLPHSLQHGVRTVEFQTPVYERQIISFAQKVLTQGHWDTAEAVQRMTLVAPPPETFEQLVNTPELTVERIVDFEDFEVLRAALCKGACWAPPHEDDYALVMVVSGSLQLPGMTLSAEQAAMLPAASGIALEPAGEGAETVVLVASPRR